ncbi:hypothetical protein [Streptomyces sp. UH6]|uniref:hypothetical protein n=1 Tax=Streptomyces sp. UH6 TaxID=2748379 RepID=UPI0015D48A2B|nr:hypothetical protein [Streptomyces sp. UH6]NYV78361.1 hypothetical protein [Streptomyces sp. UH6]
MPALAALAAALTVAALERYVEMKYGTAGLVGLLLLTVGHKAHSPTCSSAGAVVLAATVTSPVV